MSPKTSGQFKEIRADKKKLIIDTALNLFANKGYHASSISMIAKEAKISKGLMYNYFDSKEALLRAIFEDFIRIIMDLMNPNHDDEITTEEMRDFLSSYFQLVEQNHLYWKLYFQLSVKSEIFDLLVNDSYSEQMEKTQRLINRYFSERFKEPDIEITLFISILKGFALDYLHSNKTYPQSKIEGFKKKMFEMFLR
ncbi:MAG TPA: TetR/AcrR family transcriptional regulator [Bacteroidales bacterium]|nr:TetR/AcrR family transcriptional regulator [Bacteroidales bacterium]HOR60354.1 TetR/AcrR family transcriptional regulator [Bacteroidales bacterium]HPL04268.1 TetR/AcrR family transcriptional regulator [Bacteroidales bacterium]HPX75606.1 TetR/AcrR family transcriptional regulator [Bacteroidales bacterium]HQB22252.1 TetR/AcrR family transcriptional regulator [Bacteroidales bacterium]